MDSRHLGGEQSGNACRTPEKGPNIVQQFFDSFLPSRYGELAKVKVGSMIGFVTLLTLLSTIYIFLSFVVTYISRGGADAFLDWVPEFKLQNGKLSMEEDYIKQQGNLYIYATDKLDGFKREDVAYIAESGYTQVMLVGREKISQIYNGKYRETYFYEFGDDLDIDRDWLVENLIQFDLICIAIGYALFFVGRTFWYFLSAAFYFLAAVMGRKIPAGALFRAAVYAKVPMFVIRTLVSTHMPGILITIPTFVILGFAVRQMAKDVL